MRTWWTVYKHQETTLYFEWLDPITGEIIPFDVGYTFTFELVSNNVSYLVKSSGIVGSATSPNVAVVFGAGELAPIGVVPGLYLGLLTARRTLDSVDFVFRAEDPPIVEVKLTPVPVL